MFIKPQYPNINFEWRVVDQTESVTLDMEKKIWSNASLF